MSNLAARVDETLTTHLQTWNTTTTLLALALSILLLYPILATLTTADPDTHPLLLARQSAINPVRRKFESAVYRSSEVPFGGPLKQGLGIRAEGAPVWARKREGDLRDVWREVVRSGSGSGDGKGEGRGGAGEGTEVRPVGMIMSVMGREEIVERDFQELSREIVILGRYLRQRLGEAGVEGGKVAIYLPNGVEFLQMIFACAFYGLTPILLPYNLPQPLIHELLNTTHADGLICSAGSLSLDDIADACPSLRVLTWIVEKTSRHMDWNGIPDSAADHLTVSVWHDIIETTTTETSDTTSFALPSNEDSPPLGSLITITLPPSSSDETSAQITPTITTLTQTNLTSALASLISALPLRQRLSPTDLLLPAHHFSNLYVLLQTLAALYQHASLALTSVAQAGVDLQLAYRGVSPTVIIASAQTLSAIHERETRSVVSAAQKFGNYSRAQALAAGRMPTDGWLFRLLAPSASASESKPGKLRLLLVAHELSGHNNRSGEALPLTPPLSSTQLSDLRLLLKARICYALTHPAVAGAVAQTHVFDYRRWEGLRAGHFGVPLSSLEVCLRSPGDDAKVVGGQGSVEGEVWVRGPSVVRKAERSGDEEGWMILGVEGRFGEDGTLSLA